ncbi:hypothetical protein [Microbacterium halophytorum]|uniref:hypothetical protein n=1 Tax=Microbacterium halophytorum TaxID=2067568 RepID=UPI000CFC09AF|nr:hypothetical protein [Microbacterium halophytorum]
MVWIPRTGGDFPLVPFLVALGVLVLCLLILWWDRRRKRRDPDRGGRGYAPVNPYIPPEPPAEPSALGAEERWLLGFAAPRAAYEEGIDPTRWDLGPHAHEAPGPRGAAAWQSARSARESDFATAPTPQARALAAVELAWCIREGVASGRITEAMARNDTRMIAEQMRSDAGDWLAFGDLLGERQGMARPGELYRPGAPWADPEWPR